MAPSGSKFKMMVLLFTDIEGSVEYKSRHGDVAYSQALKRHNSIFKTIVEAIADAKVMNNLGDGFLASFSTVSDALQAALRFQYAMAKEPWAPAPIKSRVGVHCGQVILETEVDESTGAPRLVGRAVDLAARVMGLALGGQILLTRAAYDDAHQYLVEHPPVSDGPTPALKLMGHGKWIFKGSETEPPMEVFEIGGVGIAPMKGPSGGKATLVGDTSQKAPGWRPLTGQVIPNRTGWVLQKMLGRGGFGEAWLAVEDTTGDRRVFKFCFDSNRLKSLRQESELLGLLKGSLGQRADIAGLIGVRVDEKLAEPYFLELEYAEGGNLADWAETVGGIENVPMDTRIDLVRQVAEATEAAHSVGIIHKDIKPSNVLIYFDAEGTPRAKLSDFGIGRLTDPKYADQMTLMKTQEAAVLAENEVSTSGTAVYCPPEFYQAGEFTEQGDVYALGVLLFQVVVGDLKRPTAEGWKRDIRDPMLRQDIADCVDGDMSRRIRTAGELATRLRDLKKRKHRRHAQRIAIVVSAALMLLTTVLSAAVFEGKNQIAAANRKADKLKSEQERTEKQLAEQTQRVSEGLVLSGDLAVGRGHWEQAKLAYLNALKSMDKSQSPARAQLGLRDCYQHSPPALASYLHDTVVQDVALSRDGREVVSAGWSHLIYMDAVTQQKKDMRLPPELKGERLVKVALSRDGKRLATGSSNGAVRFWDVASGKVLNSDAAAGGEKIIGLEFSPDGNVLVAAGNDGTLRQWRGGVEGAALPPLEGGARALALSRDRMLLVDPSGRVIVRRLDSADATPVVIQQMSSPVKSVAVSDDGSRAILGCISGNAWTWEISRGTKATFMLPGFADRQSHSGVVTAVAISADGKRGVSGSSDQTVKIWDLDQAIELRSHVHTLGPVASVAFAADGNVAASAGTDDHTVNLWDGSGEGGDIRTIAWKAPNTVQCLAVSKDGQMGLCAAGKSAALLDLSSGQKLRDIDAGGQSITGAAFSPKGEDLIAGTVGGDIWIWSMATPGSAAHKAAVHPGANGLTAVAFSPDGKLAASAGADNEIALWDMSKREEISRLKGHKDAIKALAFVKPSDGPMLLLSGSSDKSMRVWDVDGKKEIQSVGGFTDGVRAIAVSGDRVITGSDDHLLRVWHLEQSKLVSMGEGIGHRSAVQSVGFVGDARIVMSADADERIKFWDLDNLLRMDMTKADELGVQQAMADQGQCVAMAGDESVMLTADRNGAVRAWQFHRVEKYRKFETMMTQGELSAADAMDWYRFRGIGAWTGTRPAMATSGDVAGNVPQ